jgi:hypothetical protein
LFPELGYVNNTAMNISVWVSLLYHVLCAFG